MGQRSAAASPAVHIAFIRMPAQQVPRPEYVCAGQSQVFFQHPGTADKRYTINSVSMRVTWYSRDRCGEPQILFERTTALECKVVIGKGMHVYVISFKVYARNCGRAAPRCKYGLRCTSYRVSQQMLIRDSIRESWFASCSFDVYQLRTCLRQYFEACCCELRITEAAVAET